MFSISPGMSAGQARGYFFREDYYVGGDALEGKSRWSGSGARALGLEGEVREEELRALCAGRDPVSGARLVAVGHLRDRDTGDMVASHRAGNDATCSASKSVSVASFLGVDGVKKAHDAAVVAALMHLEERYSLYRTPKGIRRGEPIIASFDHSTSRSADPQLHTHNLVLNLVRTPEGKWKANWNRTIFQDQKSLGLLYRQELAHELISAGFPIVFTDRSQLLFELEGIDPKVTDYFSSRRHAIEQKVAEWQEQGKFPGVPHGKLFEMAALDTRDRKRKVTREEVERIVEKGFGHCGTTRLEVKEKLGRSREIALKRLPEAPVLPASEVIRLSAQHLIDKEAVLDRARLLDQAVIISGGRHGIRELNRAIDDEATGVMRLGSNGWGRECYTTAGMRELETRNLETIRELKPFRPVVSPEELAVHLARLDAPLTAGQTTQIENELCGGRSITATVGKAGAGKTFSSKIIERLDAEVLRPQGREHRTVDVAYTARAAQEMSAASGRPAYTIDAFLNAYARGEVALQRQNPDVPVLRLFGEEIPVHEGLQLVLRVDESSFVGAQQGGHLLKVVKELQEEGVQAKLHLIGDTRQMQAIQAGGLFRQVLELEKEGLADVAHLDEIRRQRDPALLEIARTLNREDRLPGENAIDALKALELKGEVVEKARHEELVAAAVVRYREEAGRLSRDFEKAAKGEKQSVLLVTTTNADRGELNREIREARIRAGEIAEGRSCRVLVPVSEGVTADRYRKGDEVVFSGYRGEDGKMQRWGARLNTVGAVTGIDPEKNRVAVTYSFATKDKTGGRIERTVTKEFSAAEMAGRVTVYREEARQIAAGDRVVTLKNDRGLGVQNGSLGTVLNIDESGRAVVAFGAREVELDLNRYRHLDHAYAVTIHKSQGATVEHAIWFAPVRDKEVMAKDRDQGEVLPRRESFGRASFNALNVAVTRAQYGASIFTNSLPGLMREVEHLDVKTSSLTPGVRREEDPKPTHSPEKFISEPGESVPAGTEPARAVSARVTKAVDEPKIPDRESGRTRSIAPKFDGGVSLGKRLDELARVAQPAKNLPDDILPKMPRPIAPGREIVKQFERGPVKGIDHGFGK